MSARTRRALSDGLATSPESRESQKIVANLTAGLRRIYEYCFPLEDRRARQAYGVASGVNNVLIINHVTTPGRLTAILVNKTLGF